MAQKIRKPTTTPPLYLFIELLTPWLVMGLVAVLLSSSGLSLEIVFIASIVSAVAATFLMREFEKYRRRRQARRKG